MRKTTRKSENCSLCGQKSTAIDSIDIDLPNKEYSLLINISPKKNGKFVDNICLSCLLEGLACFMKHEKVSLESVLNNSVDTKTKSK